MTSPSMIRSIRILPFIMILALGAAARAQSSPDRLRLIVDKSPGGNLKLDWQDSCSGSGTDYAVYEGTLGSFAGHTSIVCSTSGASTTTVQPAPGDSYYLVVPLENGAEGSYGVDSSGAQRPTGANACEVQQVVTPCLTESFVDASPERVARLDDVLDVAAAIIESGGSFTDVATMLAGEPDVEGVYSNGISMYFSVGGLPTTIHDGVAARHGGPARELIPPPPSVIARTRQRERMRRESAAGTRSLAQGPVNADAVSPQLPRGQRMVGTDDDGDGFRDLPKHALILSPWSFDFAPNDSAPMVDTLLNSILDYQMGSVTYKSNDQDLLTDTLTLSDYMTGWDDQDIIFISSHGDADVNAPWGPDPYIWMGIGGSSCSAIAAKLKAEVPDSSTRPGLYCSFVTSIGPGANPVAGRDALGTRAFWETVHGGHLDKKLIFLDACRTAFHPGLAEALVGTDSIFMGWSEYVYTSTSTSSASSVLGDTVENGFPVLRSFVRKCQGGACKDPEVANRTAAELLAGWHRADLRTREGLHVPATPVYGSCGVSPTLPVSQTCPSCGGGIPMSMTFDVSVDGLEPDDLVFIQDPLEFGMYQLRLFADVDDVESGYAVPLTDLNMTASGDGTYANAYSLSLFMDDICPNQVIEYNPWVLLPTFDPAMSANEQRDRMYSWDGPFTIEIVPIVLP